MYAYIKYRRNIRRLKRGHKKLYKNFTLVYEKAKTPDDMGEVSSIGQDLQGLKMSIEFIQTQYYIDKCHKYLIPLPDKEDNKLFCKYNFDDGEGDIDILTSTGFYHMRKLIKHEVRDTVNFWTSIIFGLIGLSIGLISVLKN